MSKKIVAKKIMVHLAVLASGTFCFSSAFLMINNLKKPSNVTAKNLVSNIHSVKDIHVDNFSNKLDELKNIDTKDLIYKEDLSVLYDNAVYEDQDGSIYIYNDSNELISYTLNDIQSKVSKNYQKNNASDFGKDYLSQFVDNSQDYSLQDMNYDTYTNTYNIIYGNDLNGIKTTDIVYMTIANDGELVGYSTPNLDAYDDIVLSDETIENAKQEGIQAFAQKYNCVSANNLEATDVVLSKSDNQLILLVDVAGTIIDGEFEESIVDTIEVPILN